MKCKPSSFPTQEAQNTVSAFFYCILRPVCTYSAPSCSGSYSPLTLTSCRKLCKEGCLDEAIHYADICYQHGITITRETIYDLLLGCAHEKNLGAVLQVQYFMVRMGLESISSLGDHLIRVFASCGSLLEADRTFRMISRPSVYSWSAIISAHAQLGNGNMALELYILMHKAGITPDKVVFLCILKTCIMVDSLDFGRLIHHQVLEHGLDSDVAVVSTLIVAYTKCKCVEDARRLFDGVPYTDEVVWGAMIAGYVANDCGLAALELFGKMQGKGIKSGDVVYTCALKACGNIQELGLGMKIHHDIVEAGVELNDHVASCLVDMYGKCGNIDDAANFLNSKQRKHSIVSWGALMGGHVRNAHGLGALEVFGSLLSRGMKPDRLIYLYAVEACQLSVAIKECRLIHDQVIRAGLHFDIDIGNALIEAYMTCGSLSEGQKVFDLHLSRETGSWNALLSGYAESCASLAIELFKRFVEERISLNSALFVSVLKACGNVCALEEGLPLHGQVVKCGLDSEVIVASSLIDMYAKGGCLLDARKVFDGIGGTRDVIVWGVIMSAYARRGQNLAVCELYEKMQLQGVKADRVIFLCLLKACSNMGTLQQGRILHCQVIRSHLNCELAIGNTIIDMYAKCGSLDEAANAFHTLGHQDEVSWAAVLGGHVQHGSFGQASQVLDAVVQHVARPMGVFTNVLAACSHAGQVEDGLQYFKSMANAGILPDIEQYGCMLDLFSRKGSLSNAQDLLQSMPTLPDFIVRMSLLTSCRTYGELELGRQYFDQPSKMDMDAVFVRVAMWNMYAEAQSWTDVESRNLRKHMGLCR